jgi:hypothetical protein
MDPVIDQGSSSEERGASVYVWEGGGGSPEGAVGVQSLAYSTPVHPAAFLPWPPLLRHPPDSLTPAGAQGTKLLGRCPSYHGCL